jgi:hypothetical protein
MALLGLAALVLMGSWSLYQGYAHADQEINLADQLRRQTAIKDEIRKIRDELGVRRGDWNVRVVSRDEYHEFDKRIEAQLTTLQQRGQGLELLADRPQRGRNTASVTGQE